MRPFAKGAVVLSVIAAVAIAVAVWHDYPIATFGGKYLHAASGAMYEFRDGRLFENDNQVGTYTLDAGALTVRFNSQEIDAESFPATIGWNRVTLPLPKYGESVLTKQHPPSRQ